jgi:hypothetical protein
MDWSSESINIGGWLPVLPSGCRSSANWREHQYLFAPPVGVVLRTPIGSRMPEIIASLGT